MSVFHENMLIGSSGQGAPAAAGISRSLRFNSSDSASLSRASYAGSGTFSCWVKRCKLGTAQTIMGGVAFNASDQLNSSTAVFRDPSAWMHVLVSTSGTYVNGTSVASGSAITPGIIGSGCDLYLADIYFIDGQALTPSSFTEVSATTGQLIPKAYTGSFGTNGFWLKFSDNSNNTATTLGKDTSGNGNNWTPNNFSVSTSTTVYTNNFSISGTLFPGSSLANAFDGNIATSATVTNAAQNQTLTFAPSPGIAYTSGVEVYLTPTGDVSVTRYSFNGGADQSFAAGDGWKTVASGSGTLTSLVIKQGAQGNSVGISAIRINGTTILVDNAARNNDSLVDTPTSYGTDTGAGSEVRGNYATLNPLDNDGNLLSNGNLELTGSGTAFRYTRSSIYVASGKWYWECLISATGGQTRTGPQILRASDTLGAHTTGNIRGYIYIADFSGTIYVSSNPNGSNTTLYSTSGSLAAGTIVGIALDASNGKLWISVNGTWLNSGNPDTDSNPVATGLTGPYTPGGWAYNSSDLLVYNFGQRAFSYTSNHATFKALCDTNLPSPLVAKPNTVMDVLTWTGTGGDRSLTNLNFSPDLVWGKSRSNAYGNLLYDAVRGGGSAKDLSSNLTAAEGSATTDTAQYGYLNTFDSNGFSVKKGSNPTSLGDAGFNQSGVTYVAWCFDAGTTTTTNTAGSITGGAQVRANPSAGFSIITFTMGSGSYTVGHGLNTAPSLLITKARSNTSSWWTYHASLGTGSYLALNSTAAAASDYSWGSAPTSTVFTANNNFFTNGYTYVVYAFSPVAGYSSFGSYTGNGSSDGPFVFTGMRPAVVMIKNTSTTSNWIIWDKSRPGYNVIGGNLYPNLSNAEDTAAVVDFLSNGFKLRRNEVNENQNSNTYIYCAWAENPFAYARAR